MARKPKKTENKPPAKMDPQLALADTPPAGSRQPAAGSGWIHAG
jgi:hypothetical protein